MLQRFLPILLESNYLDILDLGETNLEDFSNFLESNYLPLVWKASVTHMHGLAIYLMLGFYFAPDLS